MSETAGHPHPRKLSGLPAIAKALGVSVNTASRYIQANMLRVTWEGTYVATEAEVERCKREAARRKAETGRIG